MLVDDGSKDETWNICNQLTQQYNNVEALKLAHNVGHQNALWAGMEQVVEHCDAMVSIDADLQDDPYAIIEMAKQLKYNHCDIVYGVRKERKTDSFFKRTSALAFYRVMQWVDKETIYNHADFRMMSKRHSPPYCSIANAIYFCVELFVNWALKRPESIIIEPKEPLERANIHCAR